MAELEINEELRRNLDSAVPRLRRSLGAATV